MDNSIRKQLGSDTINRMIATFMGYTIYTDGAFLKPASMSHIMEIEIPRYASDLNKLKEAVDKISETKQENYILDKNSRLQYLFKKNAVKNIPFSASMDEMLTVVIDFINFHNTFKKL